MLPIALTRYFADSRLEVESFVRGENTLIVRINKDIGPETGNIVFRQVSCLLLPTNMPGESMRSYSVNEAGSEFWARCGLADDWFDSDDVVFEIESQDGCSHFIVAKSLTYMVVAQPGAVPEPGG